jgi:hypothetical protein
MVRVGFPWAILEIHGKRVKFDMSLPDGRMADCLRCDDPEFEAEIKAIADNWFSAHLFYEYQATLFLMKLAHKTGGKILEMHYCAPIPARIEDYGVASDWLDRDW